MKEKRILILALLAASMQFEAVGSDDFTGVSRSDQGMASNVMPLAKKPVVKKSAAPKKETKSQSSMKKDMSEEEHHKRNEFLRRHDVDDGARAHSKEKKVVKEEKKKRSGRLSQHTTEKKEKEVSEEKHHKRNEFLRRHDVDDDARAHTGEKKVVKKEKQQRAIKPAMKTEKKEDSVENKHHDVDKFMRRHNVQDDERAKNKDSQVKTVKKEKSSSTSRMRKTSEVKNEVKTQSQKKKDSSDNKHHDVDKFMRRRNVQDDERAKNKEVVKKQSDKTGKMEKHAGEHDDERNAGMYKEKRSHRAVTSKKSDAQLEKEQKAKDAAKASMKRSYRAEKTNPKQENINELQGLTEEEANRERKKRELEEQKAQIARKAEKERQHQDEKEAILTKRAEKKYQRAIDRANGISRQKRRALNKKDKAGLPTHKQEQDRKGLQAYIQKLEDKKEAAEKQLDDLRQRDKIEVRPGHFPNKQPETKIETLEKRIESLDKAIESSKDRLKKRTDAHKVMTKAAHKDAVLFYQTKDVVIGRHINKLRAEKEYFKVNRHELLMKDRAAKEELMKDKKRFEELTLRLRHAKMNNTPKGKKEVAFLEKELGQTHEEVEAIDARLKEINEELAQWGAKQRENDKNYHESLVGSDQPGLSEVRAHEEQTREALEDNKTARLFTQEYSDLNDIRKENGMPEEKARRLHTNESDSDDKDDQE